MSPLNNRSVAVQTVAVEDAAEVLLGVISLEDMDLMVDPVNQKLVGVQGDQVLYLLKTMCPQLKGCIFACRIGKWFAVYMVVRWCHALSRSPMACSP